MRFITAILLLVAATVARANESLVSLDYFHAMRIPNSHVQITVDSHGVLAVATESRGKDKVARKIQLTPVKLQELKKELEEVDWKRVSADKVKGLDGTSVQLSYGKQSASLWSPDYDSKKRGLSRIQKIIESVFDLSGLDRTGMPK
jgi:hypothetical protein